MPSDWISLSTRTLALVALPLIAGLYGELSQSLIYLLGGWVSFTLVINLVLRGGWKTRWLVWATIVLDLGFAAATIGLSGLLESPLWWSLLIGPMQAGLIFGLLSMLIATGLGLVVSAVLCVILSGAGFLALIPVGIYACALMLAAAALGLIEEQARRMSLSVERQQEPGSRSKRELEKRLASTVFNMAAELNATLNFKRVLNMALDLSARILSDAGTVDEELVSALLLLTENRLHVASARRLSHADWRVSLAGESGLIEETLATGDPRLSHDPAHDPELGRFSTLQECRAVLCISLASTQETYGVLLFAHPDAHYFNAERVEFLQAIAQQTAIALQNARLYQDLEEEKERITEIQDDARKKLARDLHDGPTQTIAAIAMTINFARRLIKRNPQAAAKELLVVEDVARSTTREIRHMLFTLRPLILESKGLVAALNQLAEKTHETHRQHVIIEADPAVADDMGIDKQAVLFFIAEEAVNNARKHAEAEHIWVRLTQQSDQFVLEIEDDGVGFNVGAVDANYEQRGSLGMVNMRERTELINGKLHIKSTEGEGTCITVTVPLMEAIIEQLHQPGFTN